MKVVLHQTLHGYRNGHQLLASSEDIAMDVKKTLLFQSDLSGQIISGFEEYLSGYPIKNSPYYAFAKTWYANEMSRPGCVWTQTLLISLADLGKIPDFTNLLGVFRRPQKDNFDSYKESVEVDLVDLSTEQRGYNKIIYTKIVQSLYLYPDNTILYPVESNKNLEFPILKIWSDQWPRLRRNFSFCTGALSMRQVDLRDFDLQVVPSKTLHALLRNSNNVSIVDNNEVASDADWLKVILEPSTQTLRKFLWTFGADIKGTRENYIKLLDLYSKIYIIGLPFKIFADGIRVYLPDPLEGKSFKQSIFGIKRSFQQFTEEEIILYLLTEENLSYLAWDEYNITGRVIKTINENQLDIIDFLSVYDSIKFERIHGNILDKINLCTNDIIQIIKKDPKTLDPLIDRYPEIVYSPLVWQLDYALQRSFLRKLFSLHSLSFPTEILVLFLDERNPLILDVSQYYGAALINQLLTWLNNSNGFFIQPLSDEVSDKYSDQLIKWVENNKDIVKFKILNLLFNGLSPNRIHSLSVSYKHWISFYNILKRENADNIVTIACIILSKGIKNQVHGSEWIVTSAFNDVYKAAAQSIIDNRMWDILPKDFSEIDDDETIIEAFFKIIGFSQRRKKHQIPYWDNCEILIRVICDNYVKNRWHPQSFLDTFNDQHLFRRAILYCISFARGRDFLKKIKKNAQKKNILPLNLQSSILKELDFK